MSDEVAEPGRAGSAGAEREPVYLALCSIYREDAEYLREWVEFHRLVGFERFFLYDNGSTDDHHDVLAPYLDSGVVVLHDWPRKWPWAQVHAHEHCLEHYRDEARWISFLDVDEFLFSPSGRALPEILRDFESHPGVVVNSVTFGTSGHETKPAGLVTENFRMRAADDNNVNVKSITDPKRVDRSKRPHGPHHFVYVDGFPVNEKGEQVTEIGMPRFGDPVSFELLRVNHYWTRSEQEARRKFELWETTAAGEQRPWKMFERINPGINSVADDAIAIYLPALKEAISRLDPAE
jgi:hypothetical protein